MKVPFEVDDIVDEIGTDWVTKFWYPPRGQVGDRWLPPMSSKDDQLNLDSVQVLFYLFCIQIGLAVGGMVASGFEEDTKKKA